ncbi:ABC transporter permease [Pseudonocardia cypriaca]|uniref:Peptide/nickel transport system permease protein n=1 Tax=Pseudonocardia cypriaca TaxID=882449 RepID=A0A543FQ44_9PSEU|nr:ABC transporter permease [Pseudonocardia cypriaca]TQM35844.1 peptide/nickel transport system permease protein [Pseudonocardia cypriaca]
MRRADVAVVVLAVAAAWLLPLDGLATDLADRFAAPSLAHPLGTDHLGRDVLARLVDGAWISVGLTGVALAVCTVLGTAAGLLSGYAGGVAAGLVQRAVDVLVAIPAIVVGLVIAAVGGPGTGTLLLAVLVTGWSPFARLAHHLTVRERAREYVEGAVAIGAGPVRIAVRHVLPNALRPLVAHACLRFANVLLSIAGLSFLGLGVQPPTPEWGVMLAEGRQFMFLAPQLVLLPATAIVAAATFVTVLGRRLERRWGST